MTATVRSGPVRLGGVDTPLAPSPLTVPEVASGLRPAAPSGAVTCSQRLPRDVLVRLTALSREARTIRQEHAGHADLSLRLDNLAAGLDALVQSIYDETVLHLAARHG